MSRSRLFASTLLLTLSLSTTACGDDTEVIVADSAAAPAAAAVPAAPTPVLASPAEAAPSSQLPQAVVEGAKDNQSPQFLSLFEAPQGVVRLAATNAIKLWDLIGVAQNATSDPKARLGPGMAQWTQIDGPKVSITNPGTVAATAVVPTQATEQTYGFRVTVTNAAGSVSMDVRVAVEPR